jgi:hypothetical protein
MLIHYFALERLTDSLLLVNMLLSIHDRHLMSLSIIIRLLPQNQQSITHITNNVIKRLVSIDKIVERQNANKKSQMAR